MYIRTRLLQHLREMVKDKHPRYFKAKWIGKDLGLSAKQVGSNLVMLSHMNTELSIEQYSYGVGCSTWKVDRV